MSSITPSLPRPLDLSWRASLYGRMTLIQTWNRAFIDSWDRFVRFAMDFTFAAVTIRSTVPPARRWTVITTMIIGFISGIAILKGLTVMYPDEREQLTAYWTGIVLQLPISGGTLWLLIQNQHTRGQSLEIWITRYLGCFTSYGVFVWRYLNNPDAWSYVASPWSRWIIYSTLAPETVYPFVYVWIHYKNAKSKAD